MAPVKQISEAVTHVFKALKGANLNLTLPSSALAEIGQRNSKNVFGQAVSNIASRYPKGITTITGEIGDQFVRANATMRNGEKVVGNFEFSGDAQIIDAIRDAFSWDRRKQIGQIGKAIKPTKSIANHAVVNQKDIAKLEKLAKEGRTDSFDCTNAIKENPNLNNKIQKFQQHRK